MKCLTCLGYCLGIGSSCTAIHVQMFLVAQRKGKERPKYCMARAAVVRSCVGLFPSSTAFAVLVMCFQAILRWLWLELYQQHFPHGDSKASKVWNSGSQLRIDTNATAARHGRCLAATVMVENVGASSYWPRLNRAQWGCVWGFRSRILLTLKSVLMFLGAPTRGLQ